MAEPLPASPVKIAVIGAGSWGTALADHLGRRGHGVSLWVYEEELVAEIAGKRENSWYLPGFRLSERIGPTSSLESCLAGAGMIVFVVPSHVARSVLARMRPLLS